MTFDQCFKFVPHHQEHQAILLRTTLKTLSNCRDKRISYAVRIKPVHKSAQVRINIHPQIWFQVSWWAATDLSAGLTPHNHIALSASFLRFKMLSTTCNSLHFPPINFKMESAVRWRNGIFDSCFVVLRWVNWLNFNHNCNTNTWINIAFWNMETKTFGNQTNTN